MKYIFLPLILFTGGLLSAQQITRHYIPVADSKVYVEESGRGSAIILLHAGNCDHRMWHEQVKAFSKYYRVLNCDIRGCGFTVDGDSTYLEKNAILALMDSFHISKASFIGLSLGAVATTDFALTFPAKVNKLILASPGLIGIDLNHDSALIEFQNSSLKAWEKRDTAASAEAFVKAWVDGPLRKPNEVDKQVRQEVYKLVYENLVKRKPGVHPEFGYEPAQLSQLSKLTMPMLVIVGEKDMKDILMIKDAYKKHGAKVVTFPNAAHMVNLEQPAAFNKAGYIIANEQVLPAVGELKNLRLAPPLRTLFVQRLKIYLVFKNVPSARTRDESDMLPIAPTSSLTIGNTLVSGSLFFQRLDI